MLTLADLFEALTDVRPHGADLVITEATIDSRQAIPGSLFIALPGEKADGHQFVAHAFKKGAACALIQQPLAGDALYPVVDVRTGLELTGEAIPQAPLCLRVSDTLAALQKIAGFRRRRLSVEIIGVTGSIGKSTTKELCAEVLGQRYRTHKNPGNFNNEIGLPLTLLGLSEGHERAVLEMGFYVPGEIALLCELARPRIGVVTNIGAVHAERAGSIEAIAQGKAELVQSLPSTGWAILNYDDPRVLAMASQTPARVFTYGLDPRADLWADNVISQGLEGIHFRLHFRSETLHVRAPLIGRHSVHTALRAAALGLVDGLTWQEILSGLSSSTTQLRLVAVRSASNALLLDDTYNASPESTLAALNLLGEIEGRKIAVLGDMLELGRYENQGHELVGVRAAEVVSELVTVGERGQLIAAAAAHAGLNRRSVHSFANNEEAIAYLQQRLTAEDVVLVKGSHGLRMDRIVAALEVAR